MAVDVAVMVVVVVMAEMVVAEDVVAVVAVVNPLLGYHTKFGKISL